jgi:hypothetical protein
VNLTEDREQFAAHRRDVLTGADAVIHAAVLRALKRYPHGQWWSGILDAAERVFRRTFKEAAGTNRHPNLPDETGIFRDHLQAALDKIDSEDPDPNATTRWVATAAVNAGTAFAARTDEEPLGLEWVSMHDDRVRDAHADADGQIVPTSESFTVGGYQMRYPGDPRVPIELWINCRCVVRPVKLEQGEAMTTMTDLTITPAVGTQTVTIMPPVNIFTDEFDAVAPSLTDDDESLDVGPIPFFGVLAPEGVLSGDRRRFKSGSMRWRDLPLPLSWQKVSDDGHKGGVVVGKITSIGRDGDMIPFSGQWDTSDDADEAMRQVIEGVARGVSVDIDDATFEMVSDDGKPVDFDNLDPKTRPITEFSDGRICGATIVAIPAFQEAFIAVGTPETSLVAAAFVSDKPWSTWTKADYTPQQWRRACIMHVCNEPDNKSCHKLPIREPGGALNRNGVHAAAGALAGARGGVDAPPAAKAAAKSALRGAYRTLGETPPDSLKATDEELDAFGRGPGWVTNPKATHRLWSYWVHGPGAGKIRWGVPGDFNRCRREVGEEIGENSPGKLRFLNQICAQWHHDALGVWPGQEGGGRGHHSVEECDSCPSVSLVASAAERVVPAEWFDDPHLVGLSALAITDEGRVFGHLAQWDVCHVGIAHACVNAPHSYTNYAYFHTGLIETTAGDLSIGHITLGTGHPTNYKGYVAAMEHYDNTATVVADVRAGEDEFGIWLAGALRPDITPRQLADMKAAPLSADWRVVGGRSELMAALCVNVPGYPIPRTEVGIVDGRQVSLVAAGMLLPGPDAASLAEQIVDEIEARQARTRMAELRREYRRERMLSLAKED